MDHDIFEKYRQSGKIAAEARKYGVQLMCGGFGVGIATIVEAL